MKKYKSLDGMFTSAFEQNGEKDDSEQLIKSNGDTISDNERYKELNERYKELKEKTKKLFKN
jgi:hypothetical protein